MTGKVLATLQPQPPYGAGGQTANRALSGRQPITKGEKMSEIKTGGPAFPSGAMDMQTATYVNHNGMTLRDYFAAKAMPAVITDWLNSGDIAQDEEIPEVIARDCYIVADAMIKAREAK
jgi:hypothetical protein